MEKEASLEKFTASLRGNLLRPGDPGYDDARKVYNGMIDRRPGLHLPLRRRRGRHRVRPLCRGNGNAHGGSGRGS